ncbi:hypothetical protein BHE74_00029322 [Ensete ventricosum]|nr:hypothetical protein BHE74_00029322 [Ensete ventricosum]
MDGRIGDAEAPNPKNAFKPVCVGAALMDGWIASLQCGPPLKAKGVLFLNLLMAPEVDTRTGRRGPPQYEPNLRCRRSALGGARNVLITTTVRSHHYLAFESISCLA